MEFISTCSRTGTKGKQIIVNIPKAIIDTLGLEFRDKVKLEITKLGYKETKTINKKKDISENEKINEKIIENIL